MNLVNMKKSKTTISDWLEKHGNLEVKKQVEEEIKYINKVEMLKLKIKEYCKTHKLKFEKYIDSFDIIEQFLNEDQLQLF